MALPKAAAAERRLAPHEFRASRSVALSPTSTLPTPRNCWPAPLSFWTAPTTFETRYLINDFAVSRGIPWIYGAAVSSYGLTMPVIPGRTACLRCVYPEPPAGAQPTCDTAGVLNALTAADRIASSRRRYEDSIRPVRVC